MLCGAQKQLRFSCCALPKGSAMLKEKGVHPPSLQELPQYFITINTDHLSMLKTQHQKAFVPFMCVWK